MTNAKAFLLCVLMAWLSLGCGGRFDKKPIEKHIVGFVDSNGADVTLAGKVNSFSAHLGDVRTELVPFRSEGGKDNFIRNSDYKYKLSVTAEIESVKIKPGFNVNTLPKGRVRFELVTSTDVALATEEAQISFYQNQTRGTVSVNFNSLSEFDIEKAALVKVSWVYGK